MRRLTDRPSCGTSPATTLIRREAADPSPAAARSHDSAPGPHADARTHSSAPAPQADARTQVPEPRPHATARPRRHGGDRGSVLLLVPAAVLIVLVMASIAVDMSLVHLRQRQAHDLAAQAANDAATGAADQAALRSAPT